MKKNVWMGVFASFIFSGSAFASDLTGIWQSIDDKTGSPKALIEKVMQCLTAEESISAIREYGYNEVFDILAQKAAQKSHAHTYNEILVETMMFDLKGNLICESNGANTLLEELIR